MVLDAAVAELALVAAVAELTLVAAVAELALVFSKATATEYARSPNSGSRPGYARRQYDQ